MKQSCAVAAPVLYMYSVALVNAKKFISETFIPQWKSKLRKAWGVNAFLHWGDVLDPGNFVDCQPITQRLSKTSSSVHAFSKLTITNNVIGLIITTVNITTVVFWWGFTAWMHTQNSNCLGANVSSTILSHQYTPMPKAVEAACVTSCHVFK